MKQSMRRTSDSAAWPGRCGPRWAGRRPGLSAVPARCRPVWLAMKAAGLVEVLAPGLPSGAGFGVRVVVHATTRGPH
jgi:hypothetical protein